MFCSSGKSRCLPLIIVAGVLVLLFLDPTKWLAEKPANSNENYVSGWKDGCLSGMHSNSLSAPFLDKPFVNQGQQVAMEPYKNAWNEGYTVCRFYQATLYGWMQTLLIIAALLFIRCRCTKNT